MYIDMRYVACLCLDSVQRLRPGCSVFSVWCAHVCLECSRRATQGWWTTWIDHLIATQLRTPCCISPCCWYLFPRSWYIDLVNMYNIYRSIVTRITWPADLNPTNAGCQVSRVWLRSISSYPGSLVLDSAHLWPYSFGRATEQIVETARMPCVCLSIHGAYGFASRPVIREYLRGESKTCLGRLGKELYRGNVAASKHAWGNPEKKQES